MQDNGRGSLDCLLVLLVGSLARSAAAQEPVLIFDLAPKHEARPYHFRTSQDDFQIEQDPAPSRANLDQLNASGSAQFSAQSLPEILQRIPTDQVTVVDLRRESHGCMNGKLVSWWVDQNAGNLLQQTSFPCPILCRRPAGSGSARPSLSQGQEHRRNLEACNPCRKRYTSLKHAR